jgi:hypothetical protein
MGLSLAALLAINKNQDASSIYLITSSAALGLFCSDPFSHALFSTRSPTGSLGFWIPRLVSSLPFSIVLVLFAKAICIPAFLLGYSVGYTFPLGRVTACTDQYSRIFLVTNLLKSLLYVFTICAALFKNQEALLSAIQVVAALSLYLVSVPIHLRYVKSDLDRLFVKGAERDVYCTVNTVKYLLSIAASQLPIYIYTTYSPFIVNASRGASAVPAFYFWDKVVRGLGSTCLPLYTRTLRRISNMRLNGSTRGSELHYLLKTMYVYIMVAFTAGLGFILIYSALYMKIGTSLYYLSLKDSIILLLAVVCCYLSNLLGVQLFLGSSLFKQYIVAVIVGAAVYVILVSLTKIQPQVIIPLTEASVFFSQLFFLLRLLGKQDKQFPQGASSVG